MLFVYNLFGVNFHEALQHVYTLGERFFRLNKGISQTLSAYCGGAVTGYDGKPYRSMLNVTY